MNTAVDDGLIKRNPCRIDGAGQEHSPERPILTVSQAFALADAFTDRRYRLLILLAVFCSLRWGELAALPRCCVDTDSGIISVRVSVECPGQGMSWMLCSARSGACRATVR